MNQIKFNNSPTFTQTLATIYQQETVSSRYFLLRLKCPEIARRAEPGQFVMLSCAENNDNVEEVFLPRPLALLDARDDEIQLLYFVAGKGTACLRRIAEQGHASLRIIGPLGRGFTPIPDVDIHLALGGGSGVAPLVFFFRRFAVAKKWHLILAARTAEHLAREDVVSVPGQLHYATDDGSIGSCGTAVDAMNALLTSELQGMRVGIYAAGPEAMLLSTAKVCRNFGLPARVSLEARMACGVGVCRACVVDGVTPHEKTGLFRRAVCHDGPVFDIKELAGW